MSDESPRIGAIDSTSNGDLPAGAAIEHSAAEPVFVPRRRILRIGIWLAASVGFVAFALLARVSTHLGVEAVPWDKHGRDYVWRVWWRSRHKIVDLGPAWGSALLLGFLVLVFVGLSVAAVWVALVSDERARVGATAGDIDFDFGP